MGRTRLAKASVKYLTKEIEEAKKRKEYLTNYLHKLRHLYAAGKISYSQYIETLHLKRDNYTIQELIEHYEHRIHDCEKLIKHHKKQIHKNRIPAYLLTFIIVAVLLYFSPINFTGFIVQGPEEQEFTQKINFQTSSSTIYEWKLENPGVLTSAKISGLIKGQGEVKIYLDDLLILDNSNIKNEQSTENSGSPITGLSIANELETKTITEEPAENNQTLETQNNSNSEEINKSMALQNETQTSLSFTNDSRDSQQEPSSSENETQEKTIQESPEEKPEKEQEIFYFSDVCEETCDLSSLNLNKSSYNLRIELSNAELTISEIKYKIIKKIEEAPEKVPENITEIPEIEREFGVSKIQLPAKLNEPVKWIENVQLKAPGKIKIKLPKQAENIKVIKKISKENAKFNVFETQEEKQVEIDDTELEYEIEYETPATYAIEESLTQGRGKKITIVGPESIHYENVLIFTDLSENLNIKNPSFVKIHWVEDNSYISPSSIEDRDNNGIYDYLEFIAPQLSNQTFNVIVITKAEHLNENREFISDIYEQVKSLDGIWSETIPPEHYIRVTFERNLTSDRDITLYPRVTSGAPKIEVYEVDKNEIIATFDSLTSNEYNKVFLDGSSGSGLPNGYSQDTFDLKILDGSVEIEHIIDPPAVIGGLVVYGEGTVTTPRYRNWTGSDFTAESSAPDLGASSTIQFVIVKSSTKRNSTAVGILDAQGDILLTVRNNTNGTFNPWLDVASIGTTNDGFRGFDIDVEDATGDFIAVYEKNTTADRTLYYRTSSGTGWSGESTITLNADVAAEAQLYVAMENQDGSNEIMMASAGTSDDITAARWDGDAWVNITTITTSAAAVDEERFGIAWESLSGDAMLAWGNGTTTSNYAIFSSSTKSWSAGALIRDRAAVVQQISLCADPLSDYIGAIIGPDGAGDLLAVMWNGTAWLSGEPTEEDTVENVASKNAVCSWTKNSSIALFTFVDSNALAIDYFTFNRTDQTWKCPANGTTVTALTTTCTTGNVMSDDIEVLRLIGDPNSNDIMVMGIDLAEDLEMFIFNGTTFSQPTTALLETTTTTISGAIEPGDFDYYRFEAGEADTEYPQFSNPIEFPSDPATYSSGAAYWFNVTITSTNGTSGIDFNFTNYTATNYTTTPSMFNVTFPDLAAGNYTYYWWAYGNGTNKNYNTSIIYSYNISKATPQGSISGTSPINYGTAGNVQGSETNNGDADVNYKLFRNNTEVSNPDTTTLGAGTYNYIYNATSGQNYTTNSSIGTFTLIVNQISSSVNLTLNKTQANITIQQGNTINLNCSTISGDSGAYLALYREGSLINNGTSPIGNTTTFNTIQVENITCIYQTTQNYTTSSETFWVNVTQVANVPPNITWVETIPATNPLENTTRLIIFNFTATDENGASDINVSTARGFFQKTNETTRQNLSCLNVSSVGNNVNFTCTIAMWYWDANGAWTINVSAKDNSLANAENSSTNFTYNLLKAIIISPMQISFDATIGATNQTSTNDPTLINNTGNYNATGNLQITGINLYGETFTSQFIDVANLTADIDTGDSCSGASCIECDGTVLQNGTDITITNSVLERGNLSQGGGVAQEQIYYCIKRVPSGISSQVYSTLNSQSWTIRILLVAIIPRRKKKQNKKSIDEDNLLKALDLLTDELKKEYSLNKKELLKLVTERLKEKYAISSKEILEIITAREEIQIPITIFSKELGALESLVKYMKETLNMSNKEISRMLNRNPRTIWTAYQKSKEKQKTLLKIKKTSTFLPVKIFKNRKLTVLEATTLHLKEKGMKYSEIAKLIKRDQRNIWKIYSKAWKKSKKDL